MKLNNINVSRLTSILGAKGKTSKGFALLKTTKSRIIAGALAFTLASGGIAAGVGVFGHTNSGNSNELPPESPAITNTSETPADTQTPDDQFGMLADGLEIDGLGMNNTMLTIEEQAAKLAEEMGATYKGDVYTAPDGGSSWTSEEDYEKAVEAGIADKAEGTEAVSYDKEVFVANDGTAFETAADRDAWNAYLDNQAKGNTEAVLETEGNYFVAPDGTVWTSESEYQNYVSSNSGNTVTPVDNGTIIEAGEGYRDPDGNYWTSESEYLAYVNSLGQNGITENTIGTGDVTYEDNFYHAPDGSVWSSEQEYLNYVNSNNNNNTRTTSSNEDAQTYTDTQDSVVEDNFYHAPDGTVWASEQEYQNYINAEATPATTSYTDTETETNYNTYEEDSFYYAPDGSVWASEADYIAFANSSTNVQEESSTVETHEEVQEAESQIELDELGGYVDPETGFYCVKGEFYASKADYIAIMQMEEDTQKTR